MTKQAPKTDPSQANGAGEVLNVEEVAELLGLGKNTVYDAANAGQLPHRRLGRRLLFSRTAILAWLENKPAANE